MTAETRPFKEYEDIWRRRLRSERQGGLRAARPKKEAAMELARLLVERYGARKVHLIGSLARGTGVHSSSDIDLAVEGLPSSRYFEALTELWDRLPPGVELDLIPLEFATPAMREVVDREGVLVLAGE